MYIEPSEVRCGLSPCSFVLIVIQKAPGFGFIVYSLYLIFFYYRK